MINKWIPFMMWAIGFSLLSCGAKDELTIDGQLPIDSLAEVRLVNLMSGEQVLLDTITPSRFQLQASGIPQGIYLLEFTWDRHQLKPAEIKDRARFNVEELPKYYLSKAIWIDHQVNQHFNISSTSKLTQSALEDRLFTRSGMVDVQANGNRENAGVFEAFLEIGARYHTNNQLAQDSVRHMLYIANESGAYARSRELHTQMGVEWADGVKEQMQQEEVAYLQRHNRSPIVPYILYGRVTSQADFDRYQPVYENLETPVKEKVSVWFAKYQ